MTDIILYEVQELESGRFRFSEGWTVADIYFLCSFEGWKVADTVFLRNFIQRTMSATFQPSEIHKQSMSATFRHTALGKKICRPLSSPLKSYVGHFATLIFGHNPPLSAKLSVLFAIPNSQPNRLTVLRKITLPLLRSLPLLLLLLLLLAVLAQKLS